jgi:5-bromo-4-chloroindolyl phosphate hydrolysis protein
MRVKKRLFDNTGRLTSFALSSGLVEKCQGVALRKTHGHYIVTKKSYTFVTHNLNHARAKFDNLKGV